MLVKYMYCMTAKGIRARGKPKGWSNRTGSLQPRHVQNRAVQQMARDWELPLWWSLPVCSWHCGTSSCHSSPSLQDRGLSHGSFWWSLPLWSSLSFPPCSHWGGEAHASTEAWLTSPLGSTAFWTSYHQLKLGFEVWYDAFRDGRSYVYSSTQTSYHTIV